MRRRGDKRSTRLRYMPLVFAFLVLTGNVLLRSGAPIYAQGQDSASAGGNTWVARWIDLTSTQPASAQPKGSEDASLIYDLTRGRTILYGGKDDGDLSSKETWAFDAAERKWARIATPGSTPPVSEDHTTIYDPNSHRLILYGGENGPTSNKLWSLDLKTSAWRELTNAQIPRREAHTAVYDSRGKRMIVFGGFDRTSNDLYDVWAMDLDPTSPTFEKWQNITVAEGRPPGRIDSVAVYDPVKNRMVFNGGWTKNSKGLLGDTWAFYFADTPGGSGRWEKMTGTVQPPARRHASAAYDSDRNLFVMFGGQGATGFLNDLWAFDLTHDVWMKLTPELSPMARIDHQVVYDPGTHRVLLYGGDGGLKDKKLHDVWELDLSPASPVSLTTRGAQ
jgi:Galactose oxidase, central domain